MIGRVVIAAMASAVTAVALAQRVGEPCLIAHHDGAGIVRGPFPNFGIGVIVRGTLTGAAAPSQGTETSFYDFLSLRGELMPFAPVVYPLPPGQAINYFGMRAADCEGGAMVSDFMGGTITPPGNLGPGAVYRLQTSDNALPPPIEAPFPDAYRFGYSLGVTEPLLVVGAPHATINGEVEQGAAYAYAFDGQEWAFEAALIGPGTNKFDGVGVSVGVDAGGFALVGGTGVKANGYSQNGAVFAFHRTPEGQWVFDQQLIEPFGQIGAIWFGRAVAISADGSTAVITANNADAQHGAAYIYKRVGQQWAFSQKIGPSHPVGSFPMYGDSAALNEDASLLAVGNAEDSEAGFASGAFYVYRRSAETGLYVEVAKTLAPDPYPDGLFPGNIDIDGDLLVVGQRVGGSGLGGIYVYSGVLGLDCNDNGIPDSCDIANRTSLDVNGDGIPDECPQLAPDLNADGSVNAADLGILLGAWGGPGGDLDGDGTTDAADLAILLGAWTTKG